MNLDLLNLEPSTVTLSNSICFRFTRNLNIQDNMRARVNYLFGFPKIDEKRFAVLEVYHRDSIYVPDSVKNYFSTINSDTSFGYISQFYPHGVPSRRTVDRIKERENKGIGTECFNMILSDLMKAKVENVFINPENERMSRFIEKRGFTKIPEPLLERFPFAVPTYCTVLS